MIHGRPVIDADSHKCENPLVFADYLPGPFRDRLSFVRDRYGEQRFRIVDRHPATGEELPRLFLQPDGYAKGTYRPYHPESTIGGLFNRVRLEHMDREGIDHQVIYGSITLAFGSILDPELAVALCRAYNDYIHDDCSAHADRLHPVGVVPLQCPDEAVREMRRCVEDLDMVGVSMAPHVPQPHPDAPERFPAIRVPKPLSHPDFRPVLAAAEELDIGLALHGAPGAQLAGGSSDQIETFTLVHVFANRSMQQMALARLIFDGAMEAFPQLRFGFLEAGAGWIPDLFHSLHEHWEKRVVGLDPDLEPSVSQFLLEFAREPHPGGRRRWLSKARSLLGALFQPSEEEVSDEEKQAFLYEHPHLTRDPLEYLGRGQVFLTVEPDDPAPSWLPHALGERGRRLCGLAVDYGHWDATVQGCVGLIADRPEIDPDYAVRLLSENALDFYGERLRRRIEGRLEPAPLGATA